MDETRTRAVIFFSGSCVSSGIRFLCPGLANIPVAPDAPSRPDASARNTREKVLAGIQQVSDG